ncbi:hypothetical protein [Azospirillum sp. TSH100]|uniref:hypothetical protein n=1 Tax=Azospirillum sp. TSH100 TaxID=652764 RepID=UPI0010AAE491|nr:hypothetical protein [Azospirillum sp. TSH100]QCG89387.1 hypothetical protein E6C72_16485 [Azospirillum sp. TSH100]
MAMMKKEGESTTNTGYLIKWIRSNYKQLWPGRKDCPKFMGVNALITSQLIGYQKFGEALVSRIYDALDNDKRVPLQFAILDLEEVGAWVLRSPKCYGILITKKLVSKIVGICNEASEAMPDALKPSDKRPNFLKLLWDDLPVAENYLMHFGNLIAYIAFTFIIHHELAHVGLGHLGSICRQGALAEDEADSQGNVILDELAGVVSERSVSGDALSKQAFETDADVHGMFYTRSLLRDKAQQLRDNHTNNGIMEHVWRTLLREHDQEQLMLFIGVAVAVLSLSPHLDSDKFETTKKRTHPPVPSRLLLAFHATGSIKGYTGKYWENRSAAIAVAIGAIARFNGGLPEKKPETDDNKSSNSRQGSNDNAILDARSWRTLDNLSIIDASYRMQEIGEYWEDLVKCLREIAPKSLKNSIFPQMLLYNWYRPRS